MPWVTRKLGLASNAPAPPPAVQPGDHVYVFSHSEDVPFLRLMFGQQEDE